MIAPSARPIMAIHNINDSDLLGNFRKKIITKDDAIQYVLHQTKPTKQEFIKVPMFTLGLPSFIDIPVTTVYTTNPKIDIPNQYARNTFEIQGISTLINKLETQKLIKKNELSINDFLVKAFSYSLKKILNQTS